MLISHDELYISRLKRWSFFLVLKPKPVIILPRNSNTDNFICEHCCTSFSSMKVFSIQRAVLNISELSQVAIFGKRVVGQISFSILLMTWKMRVNSMPVKFTETLNLEVSLPSLGSQKVMWNTERKSKRMVHLENTIFLNPRKSSSSSVGRGYFFGDTQLTSNSLSSLQTDL